MCGAGLTLSFAGPAAASHCEYCNAGLPTGVVVAPATLPPGGIVMITLVDSRARLLSHDWWDAVSVHVRDASGSEVAGALEVREELTPGIWTPAAPLEGGTYEVTVLVDLGEACGVQEHTAAVTVDSGAADPTVPGVVVEERYVVDVSDALGNLVCCDGAAPYETYVPGVSCPGYPDSRVEYGGHCTHLRAFGKKVVSVLLDEEEPSRFTIRERTQELRPASQTGRLSVGVTSPSCLEFEVVDLVTGDAFTHEHCVEEVVEEPMGTFDRPEVADELDASCAGPGYVCEGDGQWVLFDDCWTWPDGAEVDDPGVGETDTETGAPAESGGGSSGCSFGSPGSSSLLFVLTVAFASRRRSEVG